MSKLSPNVLELAREFERLMVLEFPMLRGREPVYFKRAEGGMEYVNPEANLALKAFSLGIGHAIEKIEKKLK